MTLRLLLRWVPRVVAVGALLAATRPPLRAGAPAVWPQWRGPSRDGHVAGPAWPARLGGAALKLRWRVELGPSYSGPVVPARRVFVAETPDKSEEVVRALDRDTGKELWQARWHGSVTVPGYARAHGEWRSEEHTSELQSRQY